MQRFLTGLIPIIFLFSCSTAVQHEEYTQTEVLLCEIKKLNQHLVLEPFDVEATVKIQKMRRQYHAQYQNVCDYYSGKYAATADYPWVKAKRILWKWYPQKELDNLKNSLDKKEISKAEYEQRRQKVLDRYTEVDIDWKIFNRYEKELI